MISSPGPWCCKIFIVREVNRDGQCSKLIPFGSDILDPNDVHERIMRAQAAILLPDVEPRQFLESYITEWRESGFSNDSISVEIEGSEVTELTFIDLPGKFLHRNIYIIRRFIQRHVGIIAVHDRVSEDVERDPELASKYIRNDSCLILLVYNCDS